MSAEALEIALAIAKKALGEKIIDSGKQVVLGSERKKATPVSSSKNNSSSVGISWEEFQKRAQRREKQKKDDAFYSKCEENRTRALKSKKERISQADAVADLLRRSQSYDVGLQVANGKKRKRSKRKAKYAKKNGVEKAKGK